MSRMEMLSLALNPAAAEFLYQARFARGGTALAVF